jgi:hypothetical protein
LKVGRKSNLFLCGNFAARQVYKNYRIYTTWDSIRKGYRH